MGVLGAIIGGLPVAPVDQSTHPDDLRHLLDELRPSLLIGDTEARHAISGLTGVASALVDEFVEGVRSGPAVAASPDDVVDAAVLMCRRSEGGVQPVRLGFDELWERVRVVSAFAPNRKGETVVIAREVSDNRSLVQMLASWRTGATVVVTPCRGAELVDLLGRVGATHLELASDRVADLVRHCPEGSLPLLSSAVCGDRPLAPSLVLQASRVLGVDMECAFGLVHHGLRLISHTASELDADDVWSGTDRRTVGRVRPGVDVEVIDAETGPTLRARSVGDITDSWCDLGYRATLEDRLVTTSEAALNEVDDSGQAPLAERLRDHPDVRDASIVTGPRGAELVVVLTEGAQVTDAELQEWAITDTPSLH